MGNIEEVEDEEKNNFIPSLDVGGDGKAEVEEVTSLVKETAITVKDDKPTQRTIPPPGTGQRIYEIDPLLNSHREHLDYRMRDEIDKNEGVWMHFLVAMKSLVVHAGITYREWAPGAKSASLIGDFNNWNPNADFMTQNEFGVWEIFLPNNADGSPPIPHGSRLKIRLDTPSGIKDPIPAWIKFSV